MKKSFSEKFSKRFGVQKPVSFNDYVNLALYDPEIGYYCQEKRRIGKFTGTDFYTSLSLKKSFASLLVASIETIVGKDLGEMHFVEVGSDDGDSVLNEVVHPFKTVTTVSFGSSFFIPENAIVFSNELIDALPFHRLIAHENKWKERGAYLDADGSMKECLLPELTESARETLDFLKIENPSQEGYQLDLPNLERGILKEILGSRWNGLFITFDYGKSLAELLDTTPDGTARTYHNHLQNNDLLLEPGSRDMTFHICWDQVRKILEKYGFEPICLNRQGSFFIQNAAKLLEKQIGSATSGMDSELHQIKELVLHMGNAFQVMYGMRQGI